MSNSEIYNKLLESGFADHRNSSYVWIPEMEFLLPEQMEQRKKLNSDILPDGDVTVFAVNGGGDFFAWKNDDSVVFVDSGSSECTDYAKSLADAVFRRIIEFSCGDYADLCSDEEKADMDPDDAEYYTSESDAKELLKTYVNAFGDIFGKERTDYINTLIQQGFLDGFDAFISEEERVRIVNEIRT